MSERKRMLRSKSDSLHELDVVVVLHKVAGKHSQSAAPVCRGRPETSNCVSNKNTCSLINNMK
jgi:hypothetical protein